MLQDGTHRQQVPKVDVREWHHCSRRRSESEASEPQPQERKGIEGEHGAPQDEAGQVKRRVSVQDRGEESEVMPLCVLGPAELEVHECGEVERATEPPDKDRHTRVAVHAYAELLDPRRGGGEEEVEGFVEVPLARDVEEDVQSCVDTCAGEKVLGKASAEGMHWDRAPYRRSRGCD